MSDPGNDSKSNDVDSLKVELRRYISSIHSTGSFATFGVIDALPNPGISIDPIGLIRLPLSEPDAQALARESCKAPFGLGSMTLVDESVRKTWEIEAAKVQFLNDKWQPYVDKLVKTVANELGAHAAFNETVNVRSELYKMLLYEKGAMFKAHQDTEKVPGMFGTLVICLPSQHTGGTVCLHHGEETKRLDTAGTSAFGASYLAWYGDVTHEITPVLEGFRWILTYNLIFDGYANAGSPSASQLDSQNQRLIDILSRWQHLKNAPRSLIYPLDHQYSDNSLRPALMKGHDYHRVHCIVDSCAAIGSFYVFLANMKFVDTIVNEDTDERESDFFLNTIVNPDGFKLPMFITRVYPKDLLLPDEDYYVKRDPTSREGGGYMGNDNASVEEIYKDSAIMIVRKDQVLMSILGRRHLTRSLQQLMSGIQEAIKEQVNSTVLRELLLHLRRNCLEAIYEDPDSVFFSWCCAAAGGAFLQDFTIFHEAANEIIGFAISQESENRITDWLTAESCQELGKFINLPDLPLWEDDLNKLLISGWHLYTIRDNVESFTRGWSEDGVHPKGQAASQFMENWQCDRIIEAMRSAKSVHEKDAPALVKIISEYQNPGSKKQTIEDEITSFVRRFIGDKQFVKALTIELLLWLQDPSCPSRLFLDRLLPIIFEPAISTFDLVQYRLYAKKKDTSDTGLFQVFYNYASTDDGGTSSRFLQKIQEQVSKFGTQEMKEFGLPSLLEMSTVVDTSSSHAQEFFQSCLAAYVRKTIGMEPEKPKDWARPEEVYKYYYGSEDIQDIVNEFLKDPTAQTYVLEKEITPRVLYKIEHTWNYLDLDKTKKSSITLTKTLRKWEKKHKEWEEKATDELSHIRKIPQDKLKELLADQYDGIVNLGLLKADGPDSTEDVQQKLETSEDSPYRETPTKS